VENKLKRGDLVLIGSTVHVCLEPNERDGFYNMLPLEYYYGRLDFTKMHDYGKSLIAKESIEYVFCKVSPKQLSEPQKRDYEKIKTKGLDTDLL